VLNFSIVSAAYRKQRCKLPGSITLCSLRDE
jgi:hypothetical protein